MEMDKIFDHLESLQEILSERYVIESQIEKAPESLSNQERLVEEYKKEFIEANNKYEESKARIQDLKRQLDEAVSARERGEKGMDDISTHREYEALDKEIKDATEKESQFRHDLQKEERNFDELSNTMAAAQNNVNVAQDNLDSMRASINRDIASLQEKLDALRGQEEELRPELGPELVFKFERIVRSKQNRGIVAVKGNVCDGCHMILPAQFANEVRRREDIMFCPYCSRILRYQEQDDDEETFFNFIDDTGSLADWDDEAFKDDELGDDEEHDEVKELDIED